MQLARAWRAPSAVAVLCASVVGACYAPPKPTLPEASESGLVRVSSAVEPSERPEPVATRNREWVRLRSEEWIRGKILSFDGETLRIDSAVMGELDVAWADVREILTARPFTLLLSDQHAVVGTVRVTEDRIIVHGAEGSYEVPRGEVVRMIPGRPREANYWSGKVRLSASASSGNTKETDAAVFVATTRETAASHLDLSLDSVAGTLDGSENVNNHTFRGRYDLFVSPRLYVTPLGLELFSDKFQNISLRATPFAGAGYELVDRPKLEWDVNAGVGYRITRFRSVAAGKDDTEETATLLVGSAASADLTQSIELDVSYAAQVGLEDAADTNQDAAVLVSTDLPFNLEVFARAIWKRVGAPERDEDGDAPDKDDLRFEVGLSWEF